MKCMRILQIPLHLLLINLLPKRSKNATLNLNGPKSEKLKGVCDIFNLSNIVKDTTCFTSRNKPSLLGVILVNHASLIGKTLNFNCGLSDVHNLIGFQLNIDVPSNKSN